MGMGWGSAWRWDGISMGIGWGSAWGWDGDGILIIIMFLPPVFLILESFDSIMGNSFSSKKSVSDIVSETILEVSSSFTQNCSNVVSVSQEMKSVNCSGIIKQVINSDVGQKCLNVSSISANFKNDISNSIKKKIKDRLDGQNVGIELSMDAEISKKVERVVNTVNFSEVSSCFNQLVYKQSMVDINCNGSGVDPAKGVLQEANLKIIQDCVLKSTTSLNAVNDLQSLVESIEDRSRTGSINTASIFLIAIVAVVGLIIYMMLRGG
jgi:hypothetical protein